MELLTAIFLLVVASLFFWIRSGSRNKRLPPGPAGWPLLGNIFQLDMANPIPQISAWREQFGKIFRFNLSGQDVVVVSSPELVKDVLMTKQDIFSGRPYLLKLRAYQKFLEETTGSDDTPTWKLKKKALHESLKMYGKELLKLEKVTLDCIQNTLQTLEKTKGAPFNPRDCIQELVLQILAVLTSTDSLSEEDVKLYTTAHHIALQRHYTTTIGWGTELEIFPWLRHFGNQTWKDILQNREVLWNVFNKMFAKQKMEMDVENPACVIDGLILQQLNEIRSTGKSEIFTDDMLGALCFNVFEGGLSSITEGLLSLIGILANHPEVQTRMQREIDHVLGEAEPRLEHRDKLHYVNAVIFELMRYWSSVPYLVHKATRNGDLGQYVVPKETQVWCDISTINHDPEYWEDPWTFNPERFLDEQGHLVGADHPNRRRLFNFGAGKRVCVGEVLAKNRMFLVVTSLFQKFRFLPTEGAMAPDHDPRHYDFGFILQIKNYEISAKARKVGEF